jgi:hypothetical protein
MKAGVAMPSDGMHSSQIGNRFCDPLLSIEGDAYHCAKFTAGHYDWATMIGKRTNEQH